MKSPHRVTDPGAPEHQRADVEDARGLERAMADEQERIDAMLAAWERHGGIPARARERRRRLACGCEPDGHAMSSGEGGRGFGCALQAPPGPGGRERRWPSRLIGRPTSAGRAG